MNSEHICELSDCSEFRQTLLCRPPAIVHGTVILLVIMLGAAFAWAALVKADLVVKAAGRVRPIDRPTQIFTPSLPQINGRVVEVNFEEADRVARDQVLLRLDTEQLDNDIAKVQKQISTVQDEIVELRRLDSLLAQQFESAMAKAKAELQNFESSLARARDERASRIREAEAKLTAALDQWKRRQKLSAGNFVSQQELVESETVARQAYEQLKQAKLPLDEGKAVVLRRNLTVVSDDFAVRRAEIRAQCVAKRGGADAARRELAKLRLAREQAVLRSPIDGIVVAGHIDVGDVLEPGRSVVEIAQQDGFRFEANVPSGDVGELVVGMPVKIKFDAYDYQKYGTLDGTVCFVSPDSQVRGLENDSDEVPSTGPIAYVVRVELGDVKVSRGEIRGEVKLGLGGTAEIVTGRESILGILLKKIRHSISLG